MAKYRWILKKTDQTKVEKLAKEMNISYPFASILLNRGLETKDQAIEFLEPKLKNLHNPYLLQDMEKAIKRIRKAIEEKELIFLYGDYDVDGVTSTSLLYECLKLLKANVKFYIPDRLKEGYGLNEKAISFFKEEGATLVVTVDCGSQAYKPIEYANKLGIDVVVTDHHEVKEPIPPAFALINPKDYRGEYPFEGIAGVGVAFKLAWAICEEFSPEFKDHNKVRPELRDFLLKSLELVTLGTIADVAPLIDENRIIAKYGLSILESSSHTGINALKKTSGISKAKPFKSSHVGFFIGPRINAIGRLGNSKVCVDLLTTKDGEYAGKLAKLLESENNKRRQIQQRIYKQAEKYIEANKIYEKDVILVADEKWHPGVIGIVASNLQNKYYRPVFVIAIENGIGRGSARSIEGFHLFEVLNSCSSNLIAYGGHEFAAGFKLKSDKIQDFYEELREEAKGRISKELLSPLLNIETEIELKDINNILLAQIEKMSPFGEANANPVLCCNNLEILDNPSPDRMGAKGEHLNFRVKQDGYVFRAVAFGQGDRYDEIANGGKANIAFSIQRNTWNGFNRLELEIKDFEVINK